MFVNIGAIRTGLGDLLAAARGGGVSKIVLLSFTTIRDGGEQVYALGTQHKMAEDVIKASGIDWTILRCDGFAANTLSWAASVRADSVIRAPYGEAAMALIAEQDIAAAAAAQGEQDCRKEAASAQPGGLITAHASTTRSAATDSDSAAAAFSLALPPPRPSRVPVRDPDLRRPQAAMIPPQRPETIFSRRRDLRATITEHETPGRRVVRLGRMADHHAGARPVIPGLRASRTLSGQVDRAIEMGRTLLARLGPVARGDQGFLTLADR